jgi:hypothetical protein
MFDIAHKKMMVPSPESGQATESSLVAYFNVEMRDRNPALQDYL